MPCTNGQVKNLQGIIPEYRALLKQYGDYIAWNEKRIDNVCGILEQHFRRVCRLFEK